MRYFDAHCHIQFDPYSEDRDALIRQMQEQEVGGLVVGTELGTSTAAVELVSKLDNFYAAVGLHPNHEADEWYEEEPYLRLAESPKVVALGECGLDYYRPTEVTDKVKRKQKNVFDDHIRLALKLDKPLMIHARPAKGGMDAYLDVIDMVKDRGVRGNMHFYVGDLDTTKRFLELRFTFSFTAVITFARDYDEVIKFLPLESILTETDAPYVAPASRRGQRNDPLAIPEIVAKIAEIRGEDEEVVREAVLQNAKRVFSI